MILNGYNTDYCNKIKESLISSWNWDSPPIFTTDKFKKSKLDELVFVNKNIFLTKYWNWDFLYTTNNWRWSFYWYSKYFNDSKDIIIVTDSLWVEYYKRYCIKKWFDFTTVFLYENQSNVLTYLDLVARKNISEIEMIRSEWENISPLDYNISISWWISEALEYFNNN